MRQGLLLLFFVSLCGLLSAQSDLQASVTGQEEELFELYRYLHQHPELSFQEEQTAARLASELRALDFEVTEQVGGHGVVGVLRNGEGHTVLVRADMDALPIVENTGLPYSSEVRTTDENGSTVGVMHACGHDIHMSVWRGAAKTLSDLRSQWRGTIVFIAQPAEERSGGAKAMLREGLYERFPTPDYALALHVSPTLPAGQVGFCPEFALANVDMLDITVHGEGGHGAYPHTTRDPVMLASRMVVALQTLVSREISPLEPAVVTVGSIHGGTKGNVIPNEVKLELTMRSYSDKVRQHIIEGIKRICNAIALSAGLSEEQFPEYDLRDEYTPSLYNDPQLVSQVVEGFRSRLGEQQVVEVEPSMAGEDFGRYGRTDEQVPIFLFWLGAVAPEQAAAAKRGEIKLPPLHNARFAPDYQPAIRTGVQAMSGAVLDLLNQ